jgi:hypothetical protein
MLTAQAVIRTADPDRYLARLRAHTGKMGSHLGHRPRLRGRSGVAPEIQHAEWSDAGGTITLNWGRWTVQATPGTLRLRAESADAKDLERIKDMLATRLQNFGRREHLTVSWQPAGTSASLHPMDIERLAE